MAAIRRIAGWLVAAFVLFSVIDADRASAQDATPPAAAGTPAPVRLLLDLLADPTVQRWVEQRRAETPPAAPEPESDSETTASGYLASQLVAIREGFEALGAAVPKLPAELERASIILGLEFEEHDRIKLGLLFLGFVVLGFGVEWLFRRSMRGVRAWLVDVRLDTVTERLRAVLIRLAYGMGLVVAFTLGSVGAFLLLDWPPLLREIVLGYLLALVVTRVALVLSRFLLAPGGPRFRIVPMETPAAWFWHVRVGVFVGWAAFCWVTLSLLATLGFAPDARRLVVLGCGLVQLAIALEMLWRHPLGQVDGSLETRPAGRSSWKWLVTGYFVVLYLIWVADALPVFWLGVFAVGLPAAIRVTQRSVNHILRPPGAADADVPSLYAVCLERGLRTALIIAAAFLLAHAWMIDLGALTSSDTLLTRLLRGVLTVVVIALVADFIWNVIKAVIDRTLADTQMPGQADTEEARRRARLRTLLPILRNILFVVLAGIVLLMGLSAMGFEIGPLIAGAGVVGVAIGFGAQTLVKDIISGMFFLLDDAFRVGEYIQSGSYKGTVESFSLRSIKLRHHRGPLYTVPFGELGAIQNMSRDWVIDKLTIGVTYDSDLELARKLIKQVGKELAQDPEYAPHIIETLKMQGVEQFGDFAVQLRMKMMTKPGEQFVIRRKAYAMIKKAFDANGIRFAFPTVQVAGGDDVAGAAARQSLAALAPPQPG